MPLTAFPNGVSSYGIPQIGPGISIPQPSIRAPVIYVDSVYGGDGQSGLDPGRAVATLGQAFLLAKAGSTIFLFPGTYATTAKVLTTDYVTLMGAQFARYASPDIGSPTGTIALTVRAQGFRAVNCRFFGTAADVVVQQGNGFLYDSCIFDGDLTANKGVRFLPSSTNTQLTASEGEIRNSVFRGNAKGLMFDTGAAPVGVGSTDNYIHDNRFYANTVDITAEKTGAAGTYSLQTTKISNNSFEDKDKAVYIDLTTNADGAAGSQTGTVND